MNFNYSTKAKTKTISVSSGKGGVGKSTIVANLATALADCGHKILLLDADFSMANLDLMFGHNSSSTVYDVLQGKKHIKDIIVEVAPNISLIPGGSGIYELNKLSLFEKKLLVDQVSDLDFQYDYFITDTAPGIAEHVLYFNAAAQEIFIVLGADPASLVDAYSLIKVLNSRYKENKFKVICNMVKDQDEGMRMFKRLSDVCNKFLCVSLDYVVTIPFDRQLSHSVRTQKVHMSTGVESCASRAFTKLARSIESESSTAEMKGGIQFFWQQLVEVA